MAAIYLYHTIGMPRYFGQWEILLLAAKNPNVGSRHSGGVAARADMDRQELALDFNHFFRSPSPKSANSTRPMSQPLVHTRDATGRCHGRRAYLELP